MMRKDMLVCYNCSQTFHEKYKVEASHDGLPVQVCPSCGERAGLIENAEKFREQAE